MGDVKNAKVEVAIPYTATADDVDIRLSSIGVFPYCPSFDMNVIVEHI